MTASAGGLDYYCGMQSDGRVRVSDPLILAA
jgi:hypothetical protein